MVAAAVIRTDPGRVRWSDRFDSVALSPVLGPVTFLVFMWAVFQLTTTVAAPLQDALDWLFSGPVTHGGRGDPRGASGSRTPGSAASSSTGSSPASACS